MPLPAHSLALLLTPDELEAAILRAIEPLRIELERLRAQRSDEPLTIPDAAQKLGVTVRTIQRWIKRGELEEAPPIGSLRRVVLPGVPPKR